MEKQIYQANINQKKAGVIILISGKVAFRTNKIITDKEEHYIMNDRRASPPG